MSSNTTDTLTNFQRLLILPCRTTLINPHVLCTLSYLVYLLRRYILLGIVGTVGNILNIITLSRKRLRRSSTSVFLLFLAVSDLLHIHMQLQVEQLQSVSDLFCKMSWFLILLTSQFSAWTLVLVSIERMVYLKYPVFARSKITWRSALVSSVTTLVLLSLFNGHMLFGFELKILSSSTNITSGITPISTRVCTSSTGYNQFQKHVWPTMLIVSYYGIPIGIISANTIIVINGLRRQGRQVTSTQQNANGMSDRDRRNASVSRMMTFVCAYFAITIMLFGVYFVVLEGLPPITDRQQQPIHVFILAILVTLNLSNFSLNWVFYFVCGTQFKREWREIINSLRQTFRQTFARENQMHRELELQRNYTG